MYRVITCVLKQEGGTDVAGVSYQERSVCVCVCVCGERFRQSEWNVVVVVVVVENCLVTSGIRQSVGITRVEELFTDKYTYDVACKIVQDVLKSFQ